MSDKLSKLALILGFAGLIVGFSSYGIRINRPRPSLASESASIPVRSFDEGLNWRPADSNVAVKCRYPKEIQAGDDLVVDVIAEADAWGQLTLTAQNKALKISPQSLDLQLSPSKPSNDKIVVASPDNGNRQFLLNGVFVRAKEQTVGSSFSFGPFSGSTLGRMRLPANEPPAPAETTVVSFTVLPRRTLGVTDEQLRTIQTVSGIVGIPALLAYIGNTIVGLFQRKPDTSRRRRS